MKVTHRISFDLQKHGKRQIIYVKQGDELSREIAFSIYNDGTVWTVPADVTIVQLAYCKSDHIGGCYDKMPDNKDAGSFNDSRTVITMQIHPQVLNVAGNVICELRLLNSDGQILNSFNFYVNVERSPIAMTSESEGYYNNVFCGATFTPNVSVDGVLSWTNDKKMQNPEPRNIRGPKGDQGPQGPQGPQGEIPSTLVAVQEKYESVIDIDSIAFPVINSTDSGLIDTMQLAHVRRSEEEETAQEQYRPQIELPTVGKVAEMLSAESVETVKYVDGKLYEEQQTTDFRIALNDGSIGWHSNTGNKIAICYPEDESFSDSLLKITRNAATATWNISCKNAPDRLLQVNSSSAYAAFYSSAQVASMRLYDVDGSEITTDEMLQNSIYDSIFVLAEKTNSEWYLLHPETTDDANPTRIACTKIAKNDVFLGTVITNAQSIIDAVVDTASHETYCFTFSAYSGEPVYKEKFAAVESVAVKASGNGGIMGDSCIANGENSLAIGEGTQTNVPGGYAGGRHNTSTGKLWVLGNGRESNKADAAWVDLGGNFKASGYIEDGSGNRLNNVADKVNSMWYGTSAVYKINKYPVAFSEGAATITVENPVNDIGVYAVRVGTLEYTANFVVVQETWSKVFNASVGDGTITVGFNGTELTISGADIDDGNYSVRFAFYNKTYIPAEYSRSPLYITGRIDSGKFLPDVDYTPEEIYLAFMSGRYVAIYTNGYIIPMLEVNYLYAFFSTFYASNISSFGDGYVLSIGIYRRSDGWVVDYFQEV